MLRERQELHVYVEIRKETVLTCINCGSERQPIYDIADYNRTWRHLNFMEYPCYIHAKMPRTKCGNCRKTHRVEAPWAIKSRTSFTVYFDAFILKLAKDIPMNAISRLVEEWCPLRKLNKKKYSLIFNRIFL